MKTFMSILAVLALAGCATQSSKYGSRGLASSDLKKQIDSFAEEFPECRLGLWSDRWSKNSTSKNRACVLGAIAHEMKLTADAGVLTTTLENYVSTFYQLENYYSASMGSSAEAGLPYSNYEGLMTAVRAYRESELAAKSLALQTQQMMTKKIEAENAAQVSRDIENTVRTNDNRQKKIKLTQIKLSKESEFSNYDSVKKFLELRQEFHKSKLKDINSQNRRLSELSGKVELIYSRLSKRYDGTDSVINAVLDNQAKARSRIAAVENRIQQGFDKFEAQCAATNKLVVDAFAGQTAACSSALKTLKEELATVGNYIRITNSEIEEVKAVIKSKTDELNAAGSPQLSITKKAAGSAREGILSFHIAQLGVLEATQSELNETKVTVESLINLVEDQVAEFRSDEKRFMDAQEAAMARRKAAVESARYVLQRRTESIEALYNEVEADKTASPEAGLLKLVSARESIKARQAFLKSEGRRLNATTDENRGYLKGFYAQKLTTLKNEINSLEKSIASL